MDASRMVRVMGLLSSSLPATALLGLVTDLVDKVRGHLPLCAPCLQVCVCAFSKKGRAPQPAAPWNPHQFTYVASDGAIHARVMALVP